MHFFCNVHVGCSQHGPFFLMKPPTVQPPRHLGGRDVAGEIKAVVMRQTKREENPTRCSVWCCLSPAKLSSTDSVNPRSTFTRVRTRCVHKSRRQPPLNSALFRRPLERFSFGLVQEDMGLCVVRHKPSANQNQQHEPPRGEQWAPRRAHGGGRTGGGHAGTRSRARPGTRAMHGLGRCACARPMPGSLSRRPGESALFSP